ncbi:MAG: biotin--[acetyl-CoA-carboxylase] ligase [Sphingopyxis sp.]|nr:biotin--[acetyl-CoA-carboxylase] ligase [Sphingopyxis sp.]
MAFVSFVESTGSTNTDLLNRLDSASPPREGEWHVARVQHAGRGRQGRPWAGQRGNFHGSTVVSDLRGDPPASSLALVAGLALHDAVSPLVQRPLRPHLVLKWPNDLMVGQAKLGGILLERIQSTTVVGCGVNIIWAPEVGGRITTALAKLSVAPVSVDMFSPMLADAFERRIAQWRTGGVPVIADAWQNVGIAIGTELLVTQGVYAGQLATFQGLTRDGHARLQFGSGDPVILHSGEIMLTDSTGATAPEKGEG